MIFIQLILTNPDLLVHSILRRTNSYWYIYCKRKNYCKRLLESFIGPVSRARLLSIPHLHLRLLLCPFLHLYLLFLLLLLLFFVTPGNVPTGHLLDLPFPNNPTAVLIVLGHQVVRDVISVVHQVLKLLSYLEQRPADLRDLRENPLIGEPRLLQNVGQDLVHGRPARASLLLILRLRLLLLPLLQG